MDQVRVSLVSKAHSKGRGVGFYTENLSRSLSRLSDIKLVNSKPDLVHYPYFDLFYHTLPRKKSFPTVVTIHDLTPLVMSDRYPKGIRGTINLLLQWNALRSVSAIITDSESSKRDLQNFFRISPEKIFVVPLAISSDYQRKPSKETLENVAKKFSLPTKFVLTVAGGPNPNKNLPALAEVTDRLGIPLVIVGGGLRQEISGPVHPELIDLVKLRVYNHIIYPGFVKNSELNTLYHLASLYVQPSLYEGFGLPLLEAMTTGCLVASSNASSLPEIYHQGTITFNPKSLKSMERAIVKAISLSSKQKQLQIELGQDRARDFSWKKTASLTAQVYKHVI